MTDEAIITALSLETSDALQAFMAMRQAAIEAGVIAERILVAAGRLDEKDRRIITRKAARAAYCNNI